MGAGGVASAATQEQAPWGEAQKHLKSIMSQSEMLHNTNAGMGQWGGSALAGLDPNLNTAMSGLSSAANNNSTRAADPFNYATGVLQGNGMTGGMTAPLGSLNTLASNGSGIGQPITTAPKYGDAATQAGTQNNDVMSRLGMIASGSNSPQAGGFQNLANATSGQNTDVRAMLGSGGSINTGDKFGDLAGRAGDPTASSDYLTGMARGDDLGQVNPFLRQMLDDNAGRISNRVNSSISGAGRYGSGGHTDLLARSLAEASNPILAQDYENSRQRQLAASGQIDSSRRAGEASQLGALTGQSGVQGQNIQNNFNAANAIGSSRVTDTAQQAGLLGNIAGLQQQGVANQLGGAQAMGGLRNQDMASMLAGLGGQTQAQGAGAGLSLQDAAQRASAGSASLGAQNSALGNAANFSGQMPALNNLQYDPFKQLATVGDFGQQRAQTEQDFLRQLFNQKEQMPWDQLGRYSAGISGLSGLIPQVGNQNGTQLGGQPGTSLSQMIGLGTAGASLFGAPAGGTSAAAGIGTALSAALPWLCDRRLKTDIELIGEDAATGLNVYAFRYKSDPKTYPKVVGYMADEVSERYPDAVSEINGVQVIDFARIGASP